jgi:hypothetical protein
VGAQRRRQRGEQEARIREQQRRQQAAAEAAARAREAQLERQRLIQKNQTRADEIRKARLEKRTKATAEYYGIQQHVVQRNDTAETIAKQYGLDPRAIADQVPRLRPGQRIPINVRTEVRRRIEDAARLQAEQQAPREFTGHREAIGQRFFSSEIDKWAYENITKRLDGLVGPISGLARGVTGLAVAGVDAALGGGPGGQQAQVTSPFAPYTGEFTGHREAQGQFDGEMFPPDPFEQEKVDKGNFIAGMRYAGQSLAIAYDLMLNGEDYSHIVMGGTGMFEGAGLYLTSAEFNGGTGAPMWEQFSPEFQEKILELGYREVEPGLWVPFTVEPPDYGMGGWSYPGYGGGYGFGGGGGGDYEYLSRGGQLRRKRGGGTSEGQAFRVFPEGVSPAHWRI